MNAVTTAEYVVLEQIDPNTFQQEINAHSKAGYKMVSTHVIFDDSNRAVLYNAVMVREPHTNSQTLIMILQNNILQLQSQVARLEEQVEEIEAKIDWSK